MKMERKDFWREHKIITVGFIFVELRFIGNKEIRTEKLNELRTKRVEEVLLAQLRFRFSEIQVVGRKTRIREIFLSY